LLDELSHRWFICDVGADTVVGEEVEETDEAKARKWTGFSFRSFSSFRERLIKLPDIKVGERANGNPIMRPAADCWVERPEAPQYDRLVYASVGCARSRSSRSTRRSAPHVARQAVRGASCTISDAPPCETSNSQGCRVQLR